MNVLSLQHFCDLVARNAIIDEFIPAIHKIIEDEDARSAKEVALDGLLTKFTLMDHLAIEEAQKLLCGSFPSFVELEKICTCAKSFAKPRLTDECLNDWLGAVSWLVLNCPESTVHQSPAVFHIDNRMQKTIAKTWDIALEKAPKNLEVLGNAATFFFLSDKKKSFNLLEVAMNLADDKSFWRDRISRLGF